MNAHRTRVSLLAVAMAVAGLAVPKHGSGEQFASRANSEIIAGEGLRLKLARFDKKYAGEGFPKIEQCPGESAIPEEFGGNRNFCYYRPVSVVGFDTGFSFSYNILFPNGRGAWKASGYVVEGGAMVPMFGSREIDCAIKHSGSTAEGAPFSCETKWTRDGNVSEPHWTITAKPVTEIDASDPANVDRAAALIRENCEVFDTPRCSWTRGKQESSVFLPDRNGWQSLTNWFDSCYPTPENHLSVLNSTRAVQISWSDKVGGKISGTIKGKLFAQEVMASLEASYEHSITQSDSYGEGYTYTIPYNYRSALYLQHGMLEVSGDFSIITDHDRFRVKNAVFRFPLQDDVQVEGRGQAVPRGVVMHVDVPCSEKQPSGPPPAGARSGLATKISKQ